MALEETISVPAKVQTIKRRTRQILIVAEEGSPVVANFTREKRIYENGTLVDRVPDNAVIQRVFPESGSGMTTDELTVMVKLKALVDGYAETDGEP